MLILAERMSSIYSFYVFPMITIVQSISIYCIMSKAAGPKEANELAEEARIISWDIEKSI